MMRIENRIEQLRTTFAGRLLLHALLWFFYFGALFYLGNISTNKYPEGTALMEYSKSIITTMLVFYPLLYWVWPQYWMKRKYVLSISLIFLLIILYTTADFYLEQYIVSTCKTCQENIRHDKNGYYELLQKGAFSVIFLRLVTLGIVYQLFVFLAFPLAVKIFMEYFRQRIAAMQLQQENIQLEFDFLKSQVNPHFLFNTLNNIYALILKDRKDESAEIVARLSHFMRYSLYESNKQNSQLIKEVELIKTYLSLEQIRLNDTVVNFITDIDDNNYELPPLLFMPAVENAFKFCTPGKDGSSYIFIKLTAQKTVLHFSVSNSYQPSANAKHNHGGIGLRNLKKRIEHYYPGKSASVIINDEEQVFHISIRLNLATI